ncbi:RNA polymerase sigma factor (sigma-70 family) [Pedobacter sp. UYP30]|uniref:RNA polymerase sigma factor n=1 Tax=Pedobacter sp. UYP30 TaxID=1756400 RepID=UPI00339AE9F8
MLEKEFNSKIDSHILSLRQNALRFTKDLDKANDLVQDTFLKAIRFYKQFKPDTNLRAWLFVIMKNTFINDCRRKAKKQKLVEQADKITSENLLFSAVQNKCTGSMIINDIQKVLNSIPEAHRIIFMRYVEGYKYIEIAQQQNIPLGTVKTRIHEARVVLRKQLKIYSVL